MKTNEAEFSSEKCIFVGFEQFYPWVTAPSEGSDPERDFQGILRTVLDEAFSHLDYCYSLIRDPEKRIGIKFPNGTWNGLFGQLLSGKVNMTSVVMQDINRTLAADASIPIYLQETAIMYKYPELEADIFGFIRPFQFKVWISILLVALAVVFILKGADHLMNLLEKMRGQGNNEGSEAEFNQITVWIFGLLLSQGMQVIPAQDIKRIILGIWLVTAFIVGTLYRSSLKSMLISPKVRFPFTSLQELVERNEVLLKLPESTVIHLYFKDSPEGSVHQKAYASLAGYEYRITSLIKEIGEGKYAFIVYKPSLATIAGMIFKKSGTCTYITKDNIMSLSWISLFYPKGSSLKEKIDKIIHAFWESGILRRLIDEATKDSRYCLTRDINEEILGQLRPLEIKHFIGTFMLYGIGIFIGFVVFIIELILGTYK